MDKVRSRERENLINSARIQKSDGIGFKVLSTLLVMYVLTGLMLFGMAFLLYKFHLQETFVTIGVIVVYVVAGFAGGLLMSLRMKLSCGFWGMLLGTIYFFVLFVGSVVLNHGLPQEIPRILAVWIMCACAGLLGGMFYKRQ